MRILLCALALLCTAPSLYAQECSWERDRPARGREAREDSIRKAVEAANRQALLDAAAAAGVREPRGVVVFTMERNGSEPFLRIFEGNLDAPTLAGVLPGMVQRAGQIPQRGPGRITLHTRLDTLPLPPARADGKRHECRPMLANRHVIQSAVSDWVRQQGPVATLPGTAYLSMFLSRDGRVLHSELGRRSGNLELDRFTLGLVPLISLRGATVDGVPTDVWVQLPIALR
ncbi:hypothetical protein [Longimicrobium sp.]|jgi:hypothetical protein|uniref:hypothetical protein n=1 Tax=Longimicrobium sp. TaxID=2029185 RepID=UPI002F91DA82